MQAVLVMFRPDGERRSFSIVRNMTVIGRREDCDLRIPVGDVSRKHCRIVKDGDSLRIEDLGSSNGTYHNGVRVEKDVAISAGDSVQVGPVVFVLQVDGFPADEDLHPVTADSAAAAPSHAAAEHADHDAPAMPTLDDDAGNLGYEGQTHVVGSSEAEHTHTGTDSFASLEALEPLDEAGLDEAAAQAPTGSAGAIDDDLEPLPLDEIPLVDEHGEQPHH